MKILRLFILLFICQVSAQQGGMWIPSLLEGMNEEEMYSLGSKLSASDIYSINTSSLKDAIGHFNGGCTSELISSSGLLLTNHHCGYGQIQSHSSLENDYLKNGFWASNKSEELPNEGLYVEFVISINDITASILEGVTDDMSPKKRQSTIDKNSNEIQKNWPRESWQETKVKAFYKGNQYYLFVTEKYEDIRLVGAPPSSIGKFGSDTDNWVFPRHTGDFSLFRIYADANNRPAKYDPSNKPYIPRHYLPISLNGVSEGDFTMVFGFPGRTNEYLPAVAIEHITKEFNPSNIAIRDAALSVINKKMQASDEVRIKYASKQARIANAWKKWKGENLGIEKSDAIAKRREFEKEFESKMTSMQKEKYGTLLTDFEKLYSDFSEVNIKRRNFIEIFLYANELMQITYRLYQLEAAADNAQRFEKTKKSVLARLERLYKNYDVSVDKAVFEKVMPFYTENIDATIYDSTKLTSLEGLMNMLDGSAEDFVSALNKDAAYIYAKPLISDFYSKINPEYTNKNNAIAAVQKVYMKALMEVLPDARYFPDANGTLRVTYGQVKGYAPRDAVYYQHVSYLDGVIEKYVPGDYEFDVPSKLIELYNEKNYGAYADINGKVPVCFLGTNHTTGGNSGSPAIDAHGNLIGLNFDRVWEGTMSDMNYDSEICRNIMVDIRYVLFIVDKFAGASHLIEELDLVHPKK